MSAGHKNSLGFEVNGSQGSIRFDLERLNELEVYFASDPAETSGFRTVMVTELCHPYLSHWWPPGHVIGWESTFVHQYCELLKAIAGDYQPAPSFYDGLKAQEILDAIGQAAAERRWVGLACKAAIDDLHSGREQAFTRAFTVIYFTAPGRGDIL